MTRLQSSYFSKAALLATTLTVTAAGCDTEAQLGDELGSAEQQIVEIANESTCVTLFAGQTIDAGAVCTIVDNTTDTSAHCGAGATGSLRVTYATTGGWQLVETHLAAGDDLADIPTNRAGNPQIGNFAYKSGNIAGATSYTASVPLCEFGLDGSDTVCEPVTAYLAAHASVRKLKADGTYQTETGWGDGLRFVTRGSWAQYFNLTLECASVEEPPPPPPMDCETAFSLGDECFLNIDQDGNGRGDFNRWGWRQQIDGSYTADIYAGAGQCNLSKGTLVGQLNVTVNANDTVTVRFDTNGGFVMDETHLYIGDNLPLLDELDPTSTTVAPGQYTSLHESLAGATSDSYTLPGGIGDYLIAHAVVCGNFD